MTEAILALISTITPVWWVILVLVMLCVLVGTLRNACLRLERAIRDMQDSIATAASRAARVELTAPSALGGGRGAEVMGADRSLPEGWNKSDVVSADGTVQRLRVWVVENPDEARVWRIANPTGFSLWAELLGPDIIRRVWPEEFPVPGPPSSRVKPIGR